MIDKKNKIRIDITISKKQFKWLDQQAKKLHITKSQFITWLLSKKQREIVEYLYMKQVKLDEKSFEELVEIARTPWLDD